MITVEPFTKMSAACDGCGRSASAARIAGRHFSMILCASCRADLHRLTAPTAPVLTVGAALAMPEVQRGEAVVESNDGGRMQLRVDRSRTVVRFMLGGEWSAWESVEAMVAEGYSVTRDVRLVPVDLADRDPSERGVL